MPRFRCTARKSVRNFRDAPYHLSMKAGEPISSYIHRLRVSMENCHLNKYHGNSDYNTPPKQADVLIRTLSDVGPYAELKKEYNDIMKNGRPNWERYADENEKWFLTLEYLEKRMIDAKRSGFIMYLGASMTTRMRVSGKMITPIPYLYLFNLKMKKTMNLRKTM